MKELKEIPKKNPFKVPDDYFSSLDNRIFSAIADIVPVERKRVGVFRLTRVITIAASVAIIAAVGFIATMIVERDRNNSFPEDISIGFASEAYLYDIDILTIEENIVEKDIFPEKSGANRKEIIDYLLMENIDEADIYENIE